MIEVPMIVRGAYDSKCIQTKQQQPNIIIFKYENHIFFVIAES